MPRFRVLKKEQHIQPVIVENAESPEEARKKARDGDYIIFVDGHFQCDVASPSWEVEELSDD